MTDEGEFEQFLRFIAGLPADYTLEDCREKWDEFNKTATEAFRSFQDNTLFYIASLIPGVDEVGTPKYTEDRHRLFGMGEPRGYPYYLQILQNDVQWIIKHCEELPQENMAKVRAAMSNLWLDMTQKKCPRPTTYSDMGRFMYRSGCLIL